MRHRQTGITAISFILLVSMIGLLGFAGLKLVPIYLQDMKIRKILEDVRAEHDGQNPSPIDIRTSIDKRINIEMVYNLKGRDFEIAAAGDGFRVGVQYEEVTPYLGNVSLLTTFDHSVEIRR